MDPEVLKMNNNYPFKTTDKFVWFVAVSGKKVVGFIPIEQRGNVAIINNYYIDKDQEEAFSLLLVDVVSAFAGEKSLAAVVQTEHQESFEKQGFTVEKVWKRYVKMWRDE
jgi:hypothetical protein